jgi:hypothetical protein
LALRQARFTTQALASAVIVGSRPRAPRSDHEPSSSPIANSIACRHAAMISILVANHAARLKAMSGKLNPTHMIDFKESMN